MDINNLVYSDKALDLIDNGTWVGELPGADGLELFVTGMGSPEVAKAMDAEQTAARVKNKGKPLSDTQRADCTRRVLASHVLKGWRGLTSNGAPVEYDAAKAVEWLTSRNGERFAGLVLVASQRVDMMANDFAETVAKN